MGQAKNEYDLRDVELSDFMRALALPARVAIIRLLLPAKERVKLETILESMPLTPNVVRKHITALKKTGLIIGSVEKGITYYSINDQKFNFCFANLSLFKFIKELNPVF